MEPDQTIHTHTETQNPPLQRSTVSFPGAPAPKKKNVGLKIAILVVLLLLIGGIAYFLLSSENPFTSATPSPTPTVFVQETIPTEMPTPTVASVSKDQLQVQILNGTGVPGEASLLQKEIEKLGFKSIDTGNADTKDATKTMVSFSSKVSDDVKTEVLSTLQNMYTSVDTSDTPSAGVDIKITTGPRKGQKATSNVTATPTTKVQGAKTSTTPTPSKSATTGTVTPTKSATTVTPTP